MALLSFSGILAKAPLAVVAMLHIYKLLLIVMSEIYIGLGGKKMAEKLKFGEEDMDDDKEDDEDDEWDDDEDDEEEDDWEE